MGGGEKRPFSHPELPMCALGTGTLPIVCAESMAHSAASQPYCSASVWACIGPASPASGLSPFKGSIPAPRVHVNELEVSPGGNGGAGLYKANSLYQPGARGTHGMQAFSLHTLSIWGTG